MKRMIHLPVMTVALLSVLAPSPTMGQDGNLPYESESTELDGALTFRSFLNPGRQWTAAAFDQARGEVVVFGGHSNQNLNDTWTFNGTTWVQKTLPVSPPGRRHHVMAYDAARGQVVLFGGYRDVAGVGAVNDTWVWNGETWTEKTPEQSPRALYNSAMAFDAARGQVVLFGGVNPQVGAINETWLWDGTNWTQAAPTTNPGGRQQHVMAYDAERGEVVLMGGSITDTWTWDGTNWTKKDPATPPYGVNEASMVYDSQRKQVLLYGGASFNVGGIRPETWAWNGVTWAQLNTTDTPAGRYQHAAVFDSVRNQMVVVGGNGATTETFVLKNNNDWDLWSANYAIFDMTGRPDGIWNYTTIDVPAGLTLYFKPNAANTPVRWRASGNVVINGNIILNGENGLAPSAGNQIAGQEAQGGPGGYPGGIGAVRFDQSSSYTGSPGQGPGGGAPGTGAADGWNGGQRQGQHGTYASSYGNAYIQPLLGGSGGGGGGSGVSDNGGNGGGGGGAILIESSRDITVNGGIYANGGQGSSYAGWGSGGAIRLVADRVLGGGRLEATAPGPGRIRVEGFYRSLVGNANPVASISAPVLNRPSEAGAALIISKVAGENVAQPPSGNTTTPDVVFTAAGNIAVEVSAQGIPDGTPVRLRVTTAAGVINKPTGEEPAVTLAAGKATFNLTVPAGIGTIQGFAEFTAN